MVKERRASDDQLAFLFETLAATDSPEHIRELMVDLCTIREINEMSLRLEVARMLSEGDSYKRIQDVTGSSATTIARVSKCINHGEGGYRRVFGLSSRPRLGGHPTNTSPEPKRPSRPAAGGRPIRKTAGPQAGNQVE